MTGKLSGNVALVTGGSAGIGFGMAKHLADEGARLFITGRLQSGLVSLGGNTTRIMGDVSDPADLVRIVAQIRAEAGHTDVLAANAGIYELGALALPGNPRSDRAARGQRL